MKVWRNRTVPSANQALPNIYFAEGPVKIRAIGFMQFCGSLKIHRIQNDLHSQTFGMGFLGSPVKWTDFQWNQKFCVHCELTSTCWVIFNSAWISELLTIRTMLTIISFLRWSSLCACKHCGEPTLQNFLQLLSCILCGSWDFRAVEVSIGDKSSHQQWSGHERIWKNLVSKTTCSSPLFERMVKNYFTAHDWKWPSMVKVVHFPTNQDCTVSKNSAFLFLLSFTLCPCTKSSHT